MTQLKVLIEREIATDTSILQNCWSNSYTFILAPDQGINSGWMSRAIDQIPPEYKQSCFGLLTSGSTGEPKLILGNKARSENLVRLLHELSKQ